MILFLSSLVASLDGFLIGFNLKISQVKMKRKDFCFFFCGNLILYSIVLYSYAFFQFTFFTSFVSACFYVILAYLSLFDHEEKFSIAQKHLTILTLFLLILSHSIDGTLISLGFVYEYSIWLLVFLFSFMSVFILFLGYSIGMLFPEIKYSNYVCALLFLLLAFGNFLF